MEQKKYPSLSSVWQLRTGGIVVGVALLAIFGKILWLAFMGGLAAIGVVMLGIVFIGITSAFPLLAQKWENIILAQRKEEAKKRPIETLENYFIHKKQLVEKVKQAATIIYAQIKGMEDMIADYKRKNPKGDTSKQQKQVEAMLGAYNGIVAKYRAAEDALVDLREVIKQRTFEWNFSLAGQTALNLMQDITGEEVLQDMLADTADAAVLQNFNSVFAALEVEAASLTNTKQLQLENGATLDLSAIKITEGEKVPV